MTRASSPPSAPPPVRRSARRPLTLLACGLVLAGLLLVVVMNLDRDERPRAALPMPEDVIELVPSELTAEEEAGTSAGLAPEMIGPIAGGWIQITNDRGELAQQHRFERLDPAPEERGAGVFRMTRPEIELYGRDGSVVTLSGASALARRPHDAIESGTLSGDVRIRRYEDIAGDTLDRARDSATLEIRTSEASFDNVIGEVRCPGAILAETPGSTFRGRRLTLQLNDRDDLIQRLTIETIDEIRLAQATPDDGDPASPAGPARAAGETTASERDGAPARGDARPAPSADRRPTATDDDTERTARPPVFYRLVLRDDVVIRQGTGTDARTATGDELSFVFTLESEGLSSSLALLPRSVPRSARPVDGAGGHRPVHRRGELGAIARLRDLALAAPLGAGPGSGPASIGLAPPPTDDDTVVTCTGGLIMLPVTDPARRLPSSRDALLRLDGSPVRLEDPPAGSRATCDALQFHARTGRLELLGSATEPLRLETPRLEARGDVFWVTERDGRGGLDGAGTMRLLAPDDPADTGAPDDPAGRLDIAWADGVELTFADVSDRASASAGVAGPTAALGRLREARFLRDVTLRSGAPILGATPRTPLDSGPDDRPETRAAAATPDRPAGELRAAGSVSITFEDSNGEAKPRRLVATDEVLVRDAERTLWAQRFETRFAVGPAADDAERVEELTAETGVELRFADGRRVLADRLVADGGARTAMLTGRDVLLIDDRHVIDRAKLILVDEANATYSMEGTGRFRRFTADLDLGGTGRLDPATLPIPPAATPELSVTWTDGVVIAPDGAAVDRTGEAGARRAARFSGAVEVTSPELHLEHADDMVVRFRKGRDGDGTSIESVEATGDVRARSVGDPGAIDCETLVVRLAPDPAGRAVPERLDAGGGVTLADAQHRMWSDTLAATFRPADTAPPLARSAAQSMAPSADDDRFGAARVQLDRVTADRAVEVLLPDGERVLADRLVADAGAETAVLTGDRVLVLGRDFVLDRGTELVLDRRGGSYEVRSGGRFLGLAEPRVLPAAGARLPRPLDDAILAGTTTLEASWSDTARFVDGDATGELELRGTVRAASDPSPLEHDTVACDTLTLSFEDAEPAAGAASQSTDAGTDDATSDAGARGRVLRGFLARGDARLESRTWTRADHADVPLVHHVAGRHIEYDARTLEATVEGDGELLIRDERTGDAGTERADPIAGGFGGRGTTLFRWRTSLAMTREAADLFRIEMTGDVESLHRGPDGATATFTAQRLATLVERATVLPDAGSGPTAGPTAGPESAEGTDAATRPTMIDLGGSMTMRRLSAADGVFVRTTDRDVACDTLDYDLRTGLAELGASPPRTVSVLTRDAARPFRAQRVLWDMRNDTISVLGGALIGGP